jgi:hypothetical protein
MQMKRGASMVKVGRGSVADEGTVATALARARLGGYAADAFEMEDWARPDRPAGIAPSLIADGARTVFTPRRRRGAAGPSAAQRLQSAGTRRGFAQAAFSRLCTMLELAHQKDAHRGAGSLLLELF